MDSESKPHKRRVRYSGTHPRRFEEKYKELDPQKYPKTVSRVIASGKTPAGMHRPIMVRGILDVLALTPGETVVDCTVGFGGHTVDLLKRIHLAVPKAKLYAGGGVRGLDDLRRLRDAGCAGALVATALHEGRLTVADISAASGF